MGETPTKTSKKRIKLPNFKVEKIPTLRLASLHFRKFKAFEDFTLDFSDKDEIKEFICLIGPNGTGKSTVLNAIQLLFAKVDGRTKEQIKANWGKAVRHVEQSKGGAFGEEDFLLTAKFHSSEPDIGDYEVQVNKYGFVKDHPPKIKEMVYRLCYYAQFDKELQNFQLDRKKWPTFKMLFETVTGFTIEEDQELQKYYGGTTDPQMKKMMENYVLSFFIKKPYETIHQREASDGERKIIKSFSTLLTVEYQPQIILIDNIEMHVEKKRHIALINAMKSCFPNSQIFSTTHSYYISKLLGKTAGVEDLRLVHASPVIKAQPWRLRIIDELEEAVVKLMVFKETLGDTEHDKIVSLLIIGKKLFNDCYLEFKDLQELKHTLKFFLQEVAGFFVNDVMP